MLRVFVRYSVFITVSFTLSSVARWSESVFIEELLGPQFVAVLLTALAVNVASISVIMSSLNAIFLETDSSFPGTKREIKTSISEQLAGLAIAVPLLVLYNGNWCPFESDVIWKAMLETALFLTLMVAIHSLYDTSRSVLMLLPPWDSTDSK